MEYNKVIGKLKKRALYLHRVLREYGVYTRNLPETEFLQRTLDTTERTTKNIISAMGDPGVTTLGFPEALLFNLSDVLYAVMEHRGWRRRAFRTLERDLRAKMFTDLSGFAPAFQYQSYLQLSGSRETIEKSGLVAGGVDRPTMPAADRAYQPVQINDHTRLTK